MFSKRTIKKVASYATLTLLSGMILSNISAPVSVNAEEKKVKNVIYLIADGMSDSVLTASKYYNDIQDGVLGNDKLQMDEIRTGFAKTSWANGPITDSAPAGTALSSGYKTNPGVVGLDTNNIPRATILEAAELSGLSTGIISTCEIMHATPGAFTSHSAARSDYNSIMKQEMYQNMEVVLGGGTKFYESTGGGKRNDGKDLTKDIKELGYNYVTTKQEMNNSKSDKLWGLFGESDLDYDFDRQALNNEEQPSLAEMTEKAIDVLDNNDKGFFLMVEGSKVDWAAHANDPSGTIGDIIAFDNAVKVAVDYAKNREDTIVVVTTDHANSGFSIGNEETTVGYDNLSFEDSIMQLKGFSLSAERFNKLMENKSDAEISSMITQYYGYNNITDEEIALAKEGKINKVIAGRAKIGYTTGGHTGGDVYLGVYAPYGVNKLRGTVDNTEILKYIEGQLSLNLNEATSKLFGNVQDLATELGATFSIDRTDVDNPVIVLQKDKAKVNILANTNIVEVEVEGKDKVKKELSGVSVIASEDNAYSSTDEIKEILLSALKEDNSQDNNNSNNNENKNNVDNNTPTENNNSNSNNTSNTNNKNNTNKNGSTVKTGQIIGTTLLSLLGAISAGVGAITYKRKKK